MESNLLFVYGILKRGFGADLSLEEETFFLDTARLPGARLYGIGGGVGLRFVDEDIPHEAMAQGELFKIGSPKVWEYLDYLESNGFCYTRKVVEVISTTLGPLKAWVYEHTFPNMTYDHPLEGNVYTIQGY
jgi:gamma-glutamylcyclotransferase (GGCT)/AIG2-like uncharacterized protein YtfP